MRRVFLWAMGLAAWLVSAAAGAEAGQAGPIGRSAEWMANWPAFRGPTGDGVAPPGASPPATLDLQTHLRWQADLQDAPGHGSAIVWGDRVYLSAEGDRVLAFDRATGERLWDRALAVPPPTQAIPDDPWATPVTSDDTGLAAPTPCTDGQRVYAFFGTGVLGCVRADTGEPVWAVRLVDRPWNAWGLASSPVLFGGLVIQVVDQEPDEDAPAGQTRSFVVALRVEDGQEVWRTARPVASGWATPLLVEEDGHASLITCAAPYAIAYDPAGGQERWRLEGLHGDVAGSPVDRGFIYVAGDASGEVLAIRPGGDGERGPDCVAWRYDEELPDVSSPVCDGQRYVLASSAGLVQALDARTGERLWSVERGATFWPSPVLAGGRLYLLGDGGELIVLSLEDGAELARCLLADPATASPAIAGEELFIRTQRYLWCLGPARPE